MNDGNEKNKSAKTRRCGIKWQSINTTFSSVGDTTWIEGKYLAGSSSNSNSCGFSLANKSLICTSSHKISTKKCTNVAPHHPQSLFCHHTKSVPSNYTGARWIWDEIDTHVVPVENAAFSLIMLNAATERKDVKLEPAHVAEWHTQLQTQACARHEAFLTASDQILHVH